MATRRRQVEDDGTNKEGNELARGWRENSKLQQLAHSSTPLQFRARREFQCGLHAKPYSSSCKLPVRANHICFLPVHLSLSLSLFSVYLQQFHASNSFLLSLSLLSLSFLFPFPFISLFLFIFDERRNVRDRDEQIYLRGFYQLRDVWSPRQSSLPPDETAARV